MRYCENCTSRRSQTYSPDLRLGCSVVNEGVEVSCKQSFGRILPLLCNEKKHAYMAAASINEYTEIFYNRWRWQSSLGNLSPAEFTKCYYQKQANLRE